MEIDDDRLLKHLELCDRMYRRLLAEGRWPPKPDSPDLESRDRFPDITKTL